MKTFGYVRVSTREQNPKRQIHELKKYVSDERDIIVDRITGKVGDRPGLDLLKRLLRPGDELYIHELDRLGRNKKIIKDQLLYFREKEIT
ncbi:MAG: recombinase family protein, partial [Haemophilus parainfluenzae]|nr:recombinase family protein [Haemophilus parainfluenzae]